MPTTVGLDAIDEPSWDSTTDKEKNDDNVVNE